MKDKPYITSALKDCITALVCPAGEFYPDKDYGSLIKNSIDNIDNGRLLCYARQALGSFDGVYVKNAVIENKKAVFTFMINDEERMVTLEFE